MKKKPFILSVLLLVTLLPSMASAQANFIDTAHAYSNPIGRYLFFYQEADTRLNPLQVLEKFDHGELTRVTNEVVNFGVGVKPVWIAFEVNNTSTSAAKRYLTIEAPWLDKIETYLMADQKVVQQFKLGDAYPFKARPIDERFLTVSYDFPSGKTTVLTRVESPDPLIIPLYFTSDLEHYQRSIKNSYFYGLLYGALLSLLAYNFFLYLSLKLKHYLFYSAHIAAFLMSNMAYTGHAYQLIWPESLVWQQWSNPVLMVAFGSSGILFAAQFLNSKQRLARIHQAAIAIAIVSVFYVLLLLAIVTEHRVMADLTALAFIFCYAWILIVMGIASLRRGNGAARYLIIATVTAAITATVSVLAVWNKIAFTDFRFRLVEIGVVSDAVLLSLALAYSFRVNQTEKTVAETLARVDPLTSLNNRRAFDEYANVIWANATRKQLAVSVIMLDIDHFKSVNDRYGHAAGDQVLIKLAQLLKAENRAGDITARWGGEEFIVLLPYTTEPDAIAIAERLHRDVSALPINILGTTIHINCSFGVATKTQQTTSTDELISQADEYLYYAKQTGRNRVCSSQDNDQGHSSVPSGTVD